MTRSSATWANDVEANDLGDDKPTSSLSTSSRASTSLPFDNTRDNDDDEEEDIFDVEIGWYVPVSICLLPIYLRNLKKLIHGS
eukprot:scaffold31093_cov80-Attheya_sp.AAC.9